MNCTVCGKPHSKEQPLTVAYTKELLCPGCLKGLDDHTGKSGRVIFEDDAPLYGKSPIDVAEQEERRPTGFVRSDRMLSVDEIGKAVITTNGTVKVGNMDLPITRLEII